MAVSEKLKKKLLKKKADLKNGGGGAKGLILFQEGKKRIRILPVPEDEEFTLQVTQFYLGQEIKGVISPATFGEPCAITEVYNHLNSGDDDDKETAGSFKPRQKQLAPAIAYKDEKGKEIDDRGAQLAILTNSMVNELIDWMVDEEYGDFTDPKTGYDVVVKREGKTQTDTEYSLLKRNESKLDKKYAKAAPYNIEEMVRAILPTYEETKEYIKRFLGLDDSELDEILGSKKKKKKGSKDKDKKKKKKK